MTAVHTIGPYRVPDTVLGAVRDASARTGIDFSYLMAKAATESAFNPTARAATSNATGLFQFINSTWIGMVHRHGHSYGLDAYASQIVEGANGRLTVPDPAMRREILNLRNDPTLSAYMAAEYALENQDHLLRTVGGPIGSTELYLGHFLGGHGASRFLQAVRTAPQTIGAHLFPAAAAANGPAFYADGRALTVREIYDLFDRRVSRDMARLGGDAGPIDVAAPVVAAAEPAFTGPSFFVRTPVRAGFFHADGATGPVMHAVGGTPQAPTAGGAIAPAPAGGRSLSLWTVLTASAGG